MPDLVSAHYDEKYFDWQAPQGEFGGWANQSKFAEFVSSDSRVLDFGCGGGFLLKNLKCAERLGVEINPKAAETARKNGIDVFGKAEDLPDDCLDVIISDNALEHTLQPYAELKSLYRKLKPGGRIIFVIPCESISKRYKPDDINHHLYSWSPMCIGNLFTEAGFSILEVKPYIHKWPPMYRTIARICGRKLFDAVCRIYGRIERSWFQVRVIAERKNSLPDPSA